MSLSLGGSVLRAVSAFPVPILKGKGGVRWVKRRDVLTLVLALVRAATLVCLSPPLARELKEKMIWGVGW